MALALFDLDNTLLSGDSDYEWGRFLVDCGQVDGERYEQANQRFYDDYKAGRLDINAFLRFSLEPLSHIEPAELAALHRRFMAERIEPMLGQPAFDLVAKHRDAGDTLLIITATNRFVTGPIAERLGIDALLATEAEQIEGRYTGNSIDVPCFQDGKVIRLDRWMSENDATLEDSWFYSDSHNDLPLLEKVEHPVAVDPDDKLAAIASERGWPVISLR